jgi:hypothetical protein
VISEIDLGCAVGRFKENAFARSRLNAGFWFLVSDF